MSIPTVTPIGTNVLIRLPNYFKSRERQTGSGIYVPHLEGYFEHDISHGTVIKTGQDCSICKEGDEVFFAQLCIQNGLKNMGADKCASDVGKTEGAGVPVYYLADEQAHYLFMPEERMFLIAEDMSGQHEMDVHGGIICLIRGEEVICANNYHLIKDAYDKGEVIDGVRVKNNGGILVAQPKEQREPEKRFEVVFCPDESQVSKGDIIFTKPHCDIKLEGDFNYPLLPKGIYYMSGADILAVTPQGT